MQNNMINCLVCGCHGTGKSSLIKLLLKNVDENIIFTEKE